MEQAPLAVNGRPSPQWLLTLVILGVVLSACGRKHVTLGRSFPAAAVAVDEESGQVSNDPASETSAPDPLAPKDDPSIPSCQGPLLAFAKNIWRPLLRQDCYGCHLEGGYAKQRGSNFVLVGDRDPNFLVENSARVFAYGSLLLNRVDGSSPHQGGVIYPANSPQRATLASFLSGPNPTTAACNPSFDLALAGDAGPYDMLPPERVLQKFSVDILGRLPTAEEKATAKAKGIDGVMSVLDKMLAEEPFYDWLAEVYNDVLLTDRALVYFGPVAPYRFFPEVGEQTFAQSYGVAREVPELIKYIARQNKPFTEILTANYMMVNPMSATLMLGQNRNLGFKDVNNANEFVPTVIPELQGHSGVLTSFILLQVFPTTESNRNRARAKMIYDIFLDTKVTELGMRNPSVLASIPNSQSPTMSRPECVSCHSIIDPLASNYQNYYPEDGAWDKLDAPWHKDMFPAGFEGKATAANDGQQVQWLGKVIAQDPRFVSATVKRIYAGLIGSPAFEVPIPEDKDFDNNLRAFVLQRTILTEVGKAFVASGYNIKTVVKELVKTFYYRAQRIRPDAYSSGEAALGDAGPGRQRSPENLHRAIKATVGYVWANIEVVPTLNLFPGPTDGLFMDNIRYSTKETYDTLLGGIDSRNITTRLAKANTLLARAQQDVARQISCRGVPHDFMLKKAERILFPLVEPDVRPDDASRKAVIIDSIRHLYSVLLNIDVAEGDAEVVEAYNLLNATFKEAQAGGNLRNDCRQTTFDYLGRGPNGLKGKPWDYLPNNAQYGDDPKGILRAWISVVESIMNDFRFFYD